MTEHTPIPWAATSERDWLEHGCCHDAAITAFVDGERQMLAEAHSPEDAAFIVKAVNIHKALVEALKLARARIEYLGAACIGHEHFDHNAEIVLPKIDAILAEAER